MAKKLYCGNLSYDTTEESLREAFSAFGSIVSATVIVDKMSGRSKGFGFVEMTTDEEAQAAIDGVNGKMVDGRAITVNEARPMADRPPRSSGGYNNRRPSGGGGYQQSNNSNW